MKKLILSLVLASSAVFSTVASAKSDAELMSLAEKNVVTVAQAKASPDETPISLTGTLLKHLNQDHYEFQDDTGVILLEIDDDDWEESGVKVGDRVHVLGEVDTHTYKPTDVEVLKITKLAP